MHIKALGTNAEQLKPSVADFATYCILITLSLHSVSFTCKNVTIASVIVTGMRTIWNPLQTHSKVTSPSLCASSWPSQDSAPSG